MVDHKSIMVQEKGCQVGHTSTPDLSFRIFFARAPAATLPMVSLADDLPPPYHSSSTNILIQILKSESHYLHKFQHKMCKNWLYSAITTLYLYVHKKRYLHSSNTILEVIGCICMGWSVRLSHFTVIL